MALLRSLPENATLTDLRQTYADLLEKLRPYGQRLMRGPSPLTPGQRELIAAFVSGVNSCRYCHGAHSLVARAFGVDEATLARSLDNIDIAPVDARLKPILRYVRKLTETPSQMTAADAAAVYDAGWDDEALLHAIAVCAYFKPPGRRRRHRRHHRGILRGGPEAGRAWLSESCGETHAIPNEVQISFAKAPHKAQTMITADVDR